MKQFNIEFVEERVALFTATTDEQLKAYSSDFKVPILVDKGFTLWDSLSIMEYVSEQYLEGLAWPTDKQARAFARTVCAEMHSSFVNLRSECPMNCRQRFSKELSRDAQGEITRIKWLWLQCKERYGQEGEWLFGNYSIADAMFAPIVLRFVGYGVNLNTFESTYVKTVLATPSMQAWIEAGKVEKEVIE